MAILRTQNNMTYNDHDKNIKWQWLYTRHKNTVIYDDHGKNIK